MDIIEVSDRGAFVPQSSGYSNAELVRTITKVIGDGAKRYNEYQQRKRPREEENEDNTVDDDDTREFRDAVRSNEPTGVNSGFVPNTRTKNVVPYHIW